MTYAVLVGPNMAETTILSDSEYETLKNALRFARSRDTEADAIASAVAASTEDRCSQLGGVFCYFFHALMSDLGEHAEELRAMLVEAGEQPMFIREEEGPDRFVLLKAFLEILRAQEWLGDFFMAHIERWAKKAPTPLEVMERLTEEAVNFESNIDDAKRTIHHWPEFFAPETPVDVKAQGAAR